MTTSPWHYWFSTLLLRLSSLLWGRLESDSSIYSEYNC